MSDKEALASMRLDKWLWCARFFKTRALANAAIKGNKVKLNGSDIKAAKNIRIGDKLQIRKTPFQYSITILKLSPNRQSASQAVLLFEESVSSIEARDLLAKQIKAESASFPRTRGRPTKQDRRKIIWFTRINQNSRDKD